MLKSEIISVDSINERDASRMIELMQRYYENVDPDVFRSDLAEKDWAILLRESGVIQGFSTQRLMRCRVAGEPIRLLFSGDTVIAHDHSDSLSLPVAWCRMMLDILLHSPESPLYWLLVSKGYRTYRYLSVFFNDYFPRPQRRLSDQEKDILEAFTPELFDGRLDRERWILRASEKAQFVRPGVAEITDAKRRKSDIAFFESLNPGHGMGDELVCLARFEESNLDPFILRRLLST